eukprot:359885-Pyramimonas_sp.AAC.1
MDPVDSYGGCQSLVSYRTEEHSLAPCTASCNPNTLCPTWPCGAVSSRLDTPPHPSALRPPPVPPGLCPQPPNFGHFAPAH